jgi:hypothetical protein
MAVSQGGTSAHAEYMSTQREQASEAAREVPEVVVRSIVQVRADTVWCAWFVQQPGQEAVQAFAQSFDRPAGKSVNECVERALLRLEGNRPPEWSSVRRAREAW